MSSLRSGPIESDSSGSKQLETFRYVCASCEQRNLPAFYSSLRACRIHMGRSKICNGSTWAKVSIMTRPGDVIAGGTGGMGPCPDPQHQPPGILHK